ncbi:MAG TPA: serine/threonine-protein kinase [Kofleriaceae bacterium]
MGLSRDNLSKLRALVADGTFTARFSVEREIGHGGMGRVYEGVQRESGERIAIKVLDPGLAGDPVRFQAEATILEQLDHPAIVHYVAHGLTGDGRAYLAMEWLEGETLAERLRRSRLSIAECVAVAQRVASALTYLHERDIVHRDIKPSNVFLAGGDPKRAIVIDLGIAKRLSVIGPTKTGEVIGTPGYMAPEQVRGESGIDERVDMFALGCLMYEALSGTAPFAGQVVMEVLARLLLAEPRPLDEVMPKIPPRLATLVAVLLAKNANDRTIDAAQADRELTTIAACLERDDNQSLARSPWNRPHSLGEAPTVRAQPPRSRRKLAFAAIAVAAVAVIVVAVLALKGRSEPAAPKVVAAPDAEVPRGPITLPEDIDLARKPAALVAGTVVDAPISPELGVGILDTAWCAGRFVFVTVDRGHARVSSFDRVSGAIALIAKLPIPDKGAGTALACLASGRVLLVTRDRGFSIGPETGDGTTVTGPIDFPGGVVDGVAIGRTARWLASGGNPTLPGALIEWNGDGAPRQIREVCAVPRRLAPDGNRVACFANNRLVVDDGTSQIPGPTTSDATWSADSSALYLNASPGLYRWRVGKSLARTFIAQGGFGKTFEVGPWLAHVVSSTHLARQWVARGAPKVMNPLEIGASFTLIGTIPEHDEVVIAINTPPIALRAVPITQPTTLLPPVHDRHYATISSIAFDAKGTAIATRGSDRSVIVRALADRKRTGLIVPGMSDGPSGGILSWRADGTLVLVGGGSGLFVWEQGMRLRKVPLQGGGITTAVPGGDELVIWNGDGIQELAIDGSRGEWLARSDLAKQASTVELDRTRRYALIRNSMNITRVVDLGSARSVIEVDTSQRRIMYSTLAMGERPTLVAVDQKGQVFAVADGEAKPLLELPMVRTLAAAPAGERFAITSGREVIVFDLARGIEVLRGELTANVSALGWTRDGKRLAAAADNTELVVFDVP